MSTRVEIDPFRLVPSDVVALPDEEFRALVDLDLRRSAPHQPARVPQKIVDALRSTAFERWTEELNRIARSVEGQLATRLHDHERELAELRRRMIDLEHQIRRARSGGDFTEIQALEDAIGTVELETEDAKIAYHDGRNRTLRFQSVVDEAIRESAKITRAGRVEDLEHAISLHRQRVLADLDGNESPDDIDLALWALVPSAS